MILQFFDLWGNEHWKHKVGWFPVDMVRQWNIDGGPAICETSPWSRRDLIGGSVSGSKECCVIMNHVGWSQTAWVWILNPPLTVRLVLLGPCVSEDYKWVTVKCWGQWEWIRWWKCCYYLNHYLEIFFIFFFKGDSSEISLIQNGLETFAVSLNLLRIIFFNLADFYFF